ncbi:MAG: hypothetical protein KDB96_15185, partial [Flavobacteriales bacterium]|nr:hypothetical protein [Flavobacteriales bacterium]
GLFWTVFGLTNLLFGAVTAAWLLRWQPRLFLQELPLIIVGVGLAPFLVSLVLYYALMLLPGLSAPAYVALVALPMVLLAATAGSGWARLCTMLGRIVRGFPDPTMWLFWLGSLAVVAIGVLLLLNKPLVDHDVLEYGVQGSVFLRDKTIQFVRHRLDPATGFYYVGLHGFSFPLLFTWEGLLGEVFGVHGDAWSRSITIWYSWLSIALAWSLFRVARPWLAVAGALAMTLPLGFLFLIMVYHLDSYRIFLFSAVMAALVAAFRESTSARWLLLGTLAGAHAFVHSLGAILGGILVLVVVLVSSGGIAERLRPVLWMIGPLLLAGGLHYVLDTFLGTGWIFKDIIWF